MWLLAQSKDILYNLSNVNCIFKSDRDCISKFYIKLKDYNGEICYLGVYDSEKKVDKVLTEIYDFLNSYHNEKVYTLPLNSEVRI